MKLILHTPDSESNLSVYYKRAFKEAIELFIVTAYLTEWDKTHRLNSKCKGFRVIIGKDFGITRKAACKALMRWLPPKRKGQFMVADGISGFHPKAVFWKDQNGNCFSIVGSSNLTRAAFETNYEANVFSEISGSEYTEAKTWVKSIERYAIPVSEDWLARYKEAASTGGGGRKKSKEKPTGEPLFAFRLPMPKNMEKEIERRIKLRRKQLKAYKKYREGLISLFRSCADGMITSAKFYEQLPKYWSRDIKDRLQGRGFELLGAASDFKALSQSYLRILEASDEDRDDVVTKEIDWLKKNKVVTRRAFLSEMLCLEFPSQYPILNQPIDDYQKAVNFKPQRGTTQGERYVLLAKTLRFSLSQKPDYPAKNLAELDTIIELVYRKEKKTKSK